MRVNKVTVRICDGCLDGAGTQCHTPGCVFIRHRTPFAFGDNARTYHLPPAEYAAADTQTLRELFEYQAEIEFECEKP